VIAVGNEFSSVEALWSTFEGVMGDQPTNSGTEGGEQNTGEGADAQGTDAES
jgi:DASH complex subunit DAD1